MLVKMPYHLSVMSKSRVELATDLYNDFIREIGEVAIAGDDKSDERTEPVKHLLSARSKFETLMRLYKDTERSGSTLSFSGGASVIPSCQRRQQMSNL